jgi:hypothetical protein
VHRDQAGRRGSWINKAIVYTFWSAFAGLAVGAALGAVGGFLPLEVRLAIGSLVAVAAIAVGGFGLFGYRISFPQRDCETPQHWVYKGLLPWAMKNGLALGFGATSRIGFSLWYVVPVGALLLGSPVLGAAAYGAYGLVRGLAAPVILVVMRRSKSDVSQWLIRNNKCARVLTAGQLLFLGLVTAITIGL